MALRVNKSHPELTSERHPWACANRVLSQHGDSAPIFVAQRIGALAVAGDQAGVDVWKAIAVRMDLLMRGNETPTQ